jgi:hypothetical protein
VAKLETDVESLLKFAKVGEFHYRPFAKPAESVPEETAAPAAPQQPEQVQRAPAPKAAEESVVVRTKFAELNNPVQVAPKTSLSQKFAVLASQPSKIGGKPLLKKHSFGSRALPTLDSMTTDPRDKPLIAVFLRLNSDLNAGGKKRLYLTK